MGEQLAILAASEETAQSVSAHLEPEIFNVVLSLDISEKPIDEITEIVIQNRPTLLFLDMHLGGEDENKLNNLASRPYWELDQIFSSRIELPKSVSLLLELEKVKNDLPGLIIFVFYEAAGIHLTQVLLRNGADWVWPYRLPREISVQRVVERLRLLLSRVPPLNVLVVDNSAEARATIFECLRRRHYVTHAKAGVAEENIDITAREAIAEFTKRRYDVVVMDLGLTNKEETTLETRILPNSARIFTDAGVEGFKEALGGVNATQWILEKSSEVVIVILSDYIRDPIFVSALDQCFGTFRSRVSYESKGLETWEALASTIEALFNRTHPYR